LTIKGLYAKIHGSLETGLSFVEETRAKYGIVDDDVFNFDETGFMNGMISDCLVVTNAERRRFKARIAQPGNREWVTVIQGASVGGWAIPPFIIVAGRYKLSNWFDERMIPQDWVVLRHIMDGRTTREA
jgi:hypothetical protein